MKFIDAHTHVQFAAYENDVKEVLKRALDAGVGIVNVGTQKSTSRKAVELAEEYRNEPIFATVGLHPAHTNRSFHDEDEAGNDEENSGKEEFDHEYYRKLAANKKVLAIGECGLDYFRITENEEEVIKNQKQAFINQIKLSTEVKKPLMIHCRSAYGDLIEILESEKEKLNTPSGIVHFFSGTTEDARKLLDLNFYFTFGGVITFARSYDEVVRYIPIDRILSETDAPYVTPSPYRGKRNEPAYVIEVVKKLAELKIVSEEKMAAQIIENAKGVFKYK